MAKKMKFLPLAIGFSPLVVLGAPSKKYISPSNAVRENANMENQYQQAMLRFGRTIHISEKGWDADARREFENDRSVLLANSEDDVQLFIVYAISAVVRYEHGYPAKDVLPDLEQAFLYRAILWGDSEANGAEFGELVKQIDKRLNALKDKMLQYLSESGQSDQFIYWNAKFDFILRKIF